MTELHLYSRPGCHLCDDMAAALQPLLASAGATLAIINVDAEPALREQYDWRVPVLAFEGEIICEGRLDEDAVRDALGIR